jgi:uncharacterized protein YhfF
MNFLCSQWFETPGRIMGGLAPPVLSREGINPPASADAGRSKMKKETTMSQLTQDAPSQTASSAAAALMMLGVYQASFSFGESSTSTRTATVTLQNVPTGAKTATIALQAFDVYYTDNEQYGFGEFQVALSLPSTSQASCTVTLRDNHLNERQWEGTATGLVTYFG